MRHTYNGVTLKKVIIHNYKCTGCIFEQGENCIMMGIEELKNLPCYHYVDGKKYNVIWVKDE